MIASMPCCLYAAIAPPVFFLGLGVFVQLSLRRSMGIAAAMPCPACGTAFGMRAVRDARKEHAARMDAMQKDHPGVRFHMVLVWRLLCAQCGEASSFRPSSRTLSAEPGEPRRVPQA